MFTKHFKCHSCNKEPDPERLAMIITEGSTATHNNITHFDPNDPVIVSEAEMYCSTDCCARAVIKEEIEYD
jgi:hypothetical protein